MSDIKGEIWVKHFQSIQRFNGRIPYDALAQSAYQMTTLEFVNDMTRDLDQPVATKTCPNCGGSGAGVECRLNSGNPSKAECPDKLCNNCVYSCPTCKGSGKMVACLKVLANQDAVMGSVYDYKPITRTYWNDHAKEFMDGEIKVEWRAYEK